MIFTSENGSFNFGDFYSIKSIRGLDLPPVDFVKEKVIGRNGEFIFNNGFKNKTIAVELNLNNDDDINVRRTAAREMKKALSAIGTLIFDEIDPNLQYEAIVLNGSIIDFSCIMDNMRISFDASPIQTLVTQNDLTSITAPTVLNVENNGNIKSLPIIKLNGDNNVTLTLGSKSFTYTGLEDSIFIDCNNFIVYNSSIVNKISSFVGDFLELEVGSNSISVTGTFTALDISFINKDQTV